MSSQPTHEKPAGAVVPVGGADGLTTTGATTRLTALEELLLQLQVRKYRPGSMFVANIASALEALWANRLRSILTALGIFIGIAAVIAALTLTQGANEYIHQQINSIGSLIVIVPGTSLKGGISHGTGSLNSLTLRDASSLENIPHLATESPVLGTNDTVIYARQSHTTSIQGVNAAYQSIQARTMAAGSWFSAADNNNGARVAIIGNLIKEDLFDPSNTNPLGKTIRIRDQVFTVIGVLSQQGRGLGSDDVIYVPLKTLQIRLRNSVTVDSIQVKADTIENAEQVTQAITSRLRQNHHINGNRRDDFTVFPLVQFINQSNGADQALTFLLVGIAAISLTVGGIGIMNIMLVSVTERIWEIGIRMAIGARRRDIRNQFLIEALVLCLIGGAIGLGLGLLIGQTATRAIGIPFVITTATLVIPFAVSASIALAFGIYPAIQASRLDPIVALRSEE